MERWPIPRSGTPLRGGWLINNIYMYTVYILQSITNNSYYIGHTNNIEDILKRHNSGSVTYTKKFVPWKLVYYEEYMTKSEAFKREMEIKKYKGGIKFKKLLS